jgi:hypothetical protein
MVEGIGFRDKGVWLGFRGQNRAFSFRVQGLGIRDNGLGFRI